MDSRSASESGRAGLQRGRVKQDHGYPEWVTRAEGPQSQRITGLVALSLTVSLDGLTAVAWAQQEKAALSGAISHEEGS